MPTCASLPAPLPTCPHPPPCLPPASTPCLRGDIKRLLRALPCERRRRADRLRGGHGQRRGRGLHHQPKREGHNGLL